MRLERYKYSLGLSEADLEKPHSVVGALGEYHGASVGVSGERQKLLRLLQQGNESIASWETKIRNQVAQCEYQDFADELMRDQFITGLTSDALGVKLFGKGHRHKTTQEKVKLREVVEAAKTFEAAAFANQLMKTTRNIQQEQVNFTRKSLRSSQCFWCSVKHQQPRQQHCPAMGKNVASLATSRVSAGVEHGDNLDSNSPILSLKTQVRKPSSRSATQHSLQENIVLICTSYMKGKQKSSKRKSTRHPLVILYPVVS